ncbi:E3 ubiquitin-protein ligase MIB2-like [Haliotis rubra]|uniref:E3 ubiquitin-protein ligase MIB2-like n=1 Tax=Haliotis rubra TaxID=36100 RepID=UPI001EE57F80|nr:E3 ubiquitin-protein ligase MIB2-like [Haliotis rubra]
MEIGTRVLRGPDWAGGDIDGGEGHLGTVVNVLGETTCEVLWDNGKQGTCRSGAQGKHDLLVFDTGPAGLQHTGILCNGCDAFGIAGARWTCSTCKTCNLCSVCYGNAEHDITHDFIRYDTPGCEGVKVPPRRRSVRIQAMGLFPKARVTRGNHWSSKDEDGGKDCEGEVKAVEDHPCGTSFRSMVKVVWDCGNTGSYPAAHEGKVEVKFVTEYPGTFYYRDHLGLFTGSGNAAKDGAKHAQRQSVPRVTLSQGDRVCIRVATEELQQLQENINQWNPEMLRCLPMYGTVKGYKKTGQVEVTFSIRGICEGGTHVVNEKALKKIDTFKVGDSVRIIADENEMKRYQFGHGGYNPIMARTLGKVGKVREVNILGDIVVSFGRLMAQFNPACCSLVQQQPEDHLGDPDAGQNTLEGHLLSDVFIPTIVDGRPTTDKDLIAKANGMFDAFSMQNFSLFMMIFKLDARLKNIIHNGVTPLTLACSNGIVDVVKQLLDEGVDINQPDAGLQTPLLHTLFKERDAVLEMLLARGCDVNKAGQQGITPLHLSVINDKTAYVKLLVKKKADVNIRDQNGNTPIHIALRMGRKDLVSIMLEAEHIDHRVCNRGNFNNLQLASLIGNPELLKRVMDVTPLDVVDVGMVDTRFTALHIAANNDHTDCARILIEKGKANVNAQNTQGLTPLSLACSRLNDTTVALLLRNGADVHVADSAGDTPLHFTIRPPMDLAFIRFLGVPISDDNQVRVKIACLLLQSGASVYRRNAQGKTALDCNENSAIRTAVMTFSEQMGRSSSTSTAVSASTSTQPETSEADRPTISLPCSNCLTRTVDIRLKPCGHRFLCSECVATVKQCPCCRQSFEDVEEFQVRITQINHVKFSELSTLGQDRTRQIRRCQQKNRNIQSNIC